MFLKLNNGQARCLYKFIKTESMTSFSTDLDQNIWLWSCVSLKVAMQCCFTTTMISTSKSFFMIFNSTWLWKLGTGANGSTSCFFTRLLKCLGFGDMYYWHYSHYGQWHVQLRLALPVRLPQISLTLWSSLGMMLVMETWRCMDIPPPLHQISTSWQLTDLGLHSFMWLVLCVAHPGELLSCKGCLLSRKGCLHPGENKIC